MNELSLFSEKTVTTKELAEILGVSPRTIQQTVERLKLTNVLSQVKIRGQNSFVFNEEQSTLIKLEIQKHHNLGSRQVDTVNTHLEMMQNIQRDMQWLISFNEELRKENELQKQQIAEQKPKVDSYNRISNSTGLKTIQEVADILGYGSKTYFSLLRGEKILFLTNGINLPKREYIDSGYFEVKEVPYERNGQSCLYSKVYVTAKGFLWLEKKTPKRA